MRVVFRALVALVLGASLAAAGCSPATSHPPSGPASALVSAGPTPTVILSGMATGTPIPPKALAPPYTTPHENEAVGSAIDGFGLELLRQTSPRNAGQHPNTVISPMSVHMGLAMASDGAVGPTRAEMRRTLGLTPASDVVYWQVIARFLAPGASQQLQLANSVWAQKGYDIQISYARLLRDRFSAEARVTDFTDGSGPAAVNGWVARHTNHLITRFMDRPDPSLRVLLVNTAHFLGNWETPFPKSETRPAPFHLANGAAEKVAMMHVDDAFAHITLADADVVELPYEGNNNSMLVFLPKPGVTLDSMLATMTAQSFLDARSQLEKTEPTELDVQLPKLLERWNSDLSAPLQAMGVRRAFAPMQADFSAMHAAGGLWVGSVAHATYLDVNERFTEAAAATGFAMHGGYSAPPPAFHVDRPYLMAIVDKRSGAILFLAAIRNPAK